MQPSRVVIGPLLSALFSGLALWRGSLSTSGALGALAIGSAIYLGGGPVWFGALGLFFVTSTLLGHVGRGRKETTKREFEKGDTRDACQALANGGIAAGSAIGMLLHPHPAWAAAFLGSLATANGDTWATELGVLSRRERYSLLTWRRVPRGTSGAVSSLGFLAAAAAGGAIGLYAALLATQFASSRLLALACGLIGGFFGALTDSLVGATLQGRYFCPTCRYETEGARHHCGTTTDHIGGLRLVDNDVVNALATLAGALYGVALHFLFR
jgi:uncharacterized protein (TIGR00297 family)